MNENNQEKLLRDQLLQLIPSGVGVYDVTGTTVRKEYLNDGYFQMIGALREKRHHFDGTNTVNAIHPDDLPGLLAEAAASIREKRMLEYSFRILDGKSGYFWLAIRANHVPLNEKTERFYAAYYDIDELVRTQEKLRNNELIFNDLLKYSEILHFTYLPRDHRYEIMVVPDKLKEIPKEMDDFPESFIKYFELNDSDAKIFRETLAHIDNGGSEAECDVRLRYQGTYSWFSMHLLNFLDEEGHSLRAIGNAANIDEFKEAEKAFNDEKLRMKSIQSGILSSVCVNVTQDTLIGDTVVSENFDPKTHPLYNELIEAEPEAVDQNPETLRILLCAVKEIPDCNQRKDFIHKCSHVGLLRLYDAEQRDIAFEYRRQKNAPAIWVSTHIVMLPDPGTGDVLAFFYTTDVNNKVISRKLSNRIIGANYENLSYYDLNSGMLYLDLSGPDADADFVATSYIPTIIAATEKYAAPEEKERILKEYDVKNLIAALSTETVHSIYYKGSECDESLPGHPYKRMKSDAFYLDENRDIIVFLQSNATAIYEQEREIREKMADAMRALKDANKAKTEFLSRISHDIRTPLNIINSKINFAFEDINDKKELKKDLEDIQSSSAFLLSLINDILDISKIDSGTIELHPEPYLFSDYILTIRNMFEPLCAQKNIKLNFGGKGMHTVTVDRVRLNQITLNLLSNAVKYTPSGGSITFTADSKIIENGLLECKLDVTDTGIGMSEGFQKTMFEPFTRESPTADKFLNEQGTGLGLSIVKRIVALLNGEISVKSKKNVGTEITVTLVLPEATPEEIRRKYHTSADDPQAKVCPLSGKILVAEDNPMNAEIAERLLKSFGLTVVQAANGAEAAEIFENSAENEFAAILMDIQMPVMNGYDATRTIRKLSRADAAAIPILAMTADAYAEDVQCCLDAGMNGHIPKPIDTDELHRKLSEAIQI